MQLCTKPAWRTASSRCARRSFGFTCSSAGSGRGCGQGGLPQWGRGQQKAQPQVLLPVAVRARCSWAAAWLLLTAPKTASGGLFWHVSFRNEAQMCSWVLQALLSRVNVPLSSIAHTCQGGSYLQPMGGGHGPPRGTGAGAVTTWMEQQRCPVLWLGMPALPQGPPVPRLKEGPCGAKGRCAGGHGHLVRRHCSPWCSPPALHNL